MTRFADYRHLHVAEPRLHPMGIHRGLNAMELACARASLSQPKTYQADKALARRVLISLRDLRLRIGDDGYKLP
jgi:hypothetical protein